MESKKDNKRITRYHRISKMIELSGDPHLEVFRQEKLDDDLKIVIQNYLNYSNINNLIKNKLE